MVFNHSTQPKALSLKGTMATPVLITPPSISGGTANGVLKTAVSGVFNNTPGSSIYEWKLNGVSQAFGTTFTPGAPAVGQTLTVTQTASNGWTSAPAVSSGITIT